MIAGSSFAGALTFDSTSFANNGATRTSWLIASGVAAPDFQANFEGMALGNIHAQTGLFPGMVITSSTGIANVTNSSGAMGGSNPIDLQALAATESADITMTFASGQDYFGFYRIDLNVSTVFVTYTDTTTESFATSGTGSSGNTAQFWGIYRNDKPQIASVRFAAVGGDSEYGMDNIEYGNAVPEPATMAVLGLGAAALLRKRKK